MANGSEPQKFRKIVFALAELFNIENHGDINHLARKVRIHRDTLKRYVENTCVFVRMDHLTRLCDFAVKNSNIDPSMLPAALFKYLPSEIWPLLTERDSIEISMGMRMGESFKDPLVALADALLKDSVSDGMNARTKKSPAGREHYILAPDRKGYIAPETLKQVAEIYAAFQRNKANRALVCLGSMKSNPLIEHLLAGYLRYGERFVSEDHVDLPKQRSSPVYFLYRRHDPHPDSAWGGRRLSQEMPGDGPGIYYEDAHGDWIHCPCNDDEDAALVFYRLCQGTGELEMILGGFSSYASRALARLLDEDDLHRIWEPVYSHRGVDLGIYVVRFEKADSDTSRAPHFVSPKSYEVIGLDKQTIARRFRTRPAATTLPR